uniref:Uncharacterized protein n=1 Tax=Salarias fasciatus TaxID=181472 RepID=A0A672JEV5_SALFA
RANFIRAVMQPFYTAAPFRPPCFSLSLQSIPRKRTECRVWPSGRRCEVYHRFDVAAQISSVSSQCVDAQNAKRGTLRSVLSPRLPSHEAPVHSLALSGSQIYHHTNSSDLSSSFTPSALFRYTTVACKSIQSF